MKILVEVDEYKLNSCKRHVEEGYASWYDEVIANGTVISEDATNGDIIKVMFPDYQTKISSGQVCLYYPVREEYSGSWIKFDLDWWNAPHRR